LTPAFILSRTSSGRTTCSSHNTVCHRNADVLCNSGLNLLLMLLVLNNFNSLDHQTFVLTTGRVLHAKRSSILRSDVSVFE